MLKLNEICWMVTDFKSQGMCEDQLASECTVVNALVLMQFMRGVFLNH
jgi:hypothetical protein